MLDEDIGLANPDAQVHTVTALEAAQKIGFPEARILIANVVIDLALSPKSNSAYKAMDAALADLEKVWEFTYLSSERWTLCWKQALVMHKMKRSHAYPSGSE